MIKIFVAELFIIGAALRYQVHHCGFNRSYFAGVQAFKGFEHKNRMGQDENFLFVINCQLSESKPFHFQNWTRCKSSI